jgi:glycosyltransferase involved in cell wall biosynthesis
MMNGLGSAKAKRSIFITAVILGVLIRVWLWWVIPVTQFAGDEESYLHDGWILAKTLSQARSSSASWRFRSPATRLPASAFQATPRVYLEEVASPVLITVASLSQKYNRTHILIEAVAQCIEQGLPLQLRVIGHGQYRPELEDRVGQLGLKQHIQFLGQLPAGPAVRDQLDQADKFVLPSLTEGLPPALIEAMARTLPCIGSTVGGIPKLLPSEDMIVPGDAVRLARKNTEVVTKPRRMAHMSARNLEHAHNYSDALLEERRRVFDQHVRDMTEGVDTHGATTLTVLHLLTASWTG